jgi:hypothetical protein
MVASGVLADRESRFFAFSSFLLNFLPSPVPIPGFWQLRRRQWSLLHLARNIRFLLALSSVLLVLVSTAFSPFASFTCSFSLACVRQTRLQLLCAPYLRTERRPLVQTAQVDDTFLVVFLLFSPFSCLRSHRMVPLTVPTVTACYSSTASTGGIAPLASDGRESLARKVTKKRRVR